MGKYDFGPARVHQTASLLLQAQKITQPPPWYQTINDVPPPETVVRTLPVQHRKLKATGKTRRASRMFQPQRINYYEDRLRQEFFQDHPWELARPRVIVEDDGKDYHKWDWSKAYQPGRPVNGESVIQRQLWLMYQGRDPQKTPAHTGKKAAYDQARKEFYNVRHQQAVEQRIAREEAMTTGAYFNKSALQIGMELENQTFEQWKTWANEQVVLAEQGRNAAYTGAGAQSSDATELDEVTEESSPENNTTEAAAEQMKEVVPGSKAGLRAEGKAVFHP